MCVFFNLSSNVRCVRFLFCFREFNLLSLSFSGIYNGGEVKVKLVQGPQCSLTPGDPTNDNPALYRKVIFKFGTTCI